MAAKKNEKEFTINMSREHLSASLQQHLRQFGYLKGDDDFFEVDTISFDNTDSVLVKGVVERGNPNG